MSAAQEAPGALSISASASTAAQAENEANAVADSFVSYLESRNSPIGPVQARVLTPARFATGADRMKGSTITGLIGAVAGLIAGFVVALRLDRGIHAFASGTRSPARSEFR